MTKRTAGILRSTRGRRAARIDAVRWGGGRFLHYQRARVEVRLKAVTRAAISAVFWTGAIAGLTWLNYYNLRVVGTTLLTAWIAISIPAVLLQAGLILDVLNYVLTRHSLVLPFLHQTLQNNTDEREHGALEKAWCALTHLAVVTSPLSGVATWCYQVLIALPASARIPISSGEIPGDRRQHTRREADRSLRANRGLNDLGFAYYWSFIDSGKKAERPIVHTQA